MPSLNLPHSETRRKDPSAAEGGSLRKYAYEQIEELLNTGQLKPGQLFSQRELVQRTGATLGSIREAVPRFEAEGLLVTVPKKGLMVPSLDVAFVRDAYQVRQMIECAAVPFMIERMSDKALQELIGVQDTLARELEAQGGNAAPELLNRIQREDWDMHAAFVRTMDNTLVDNIYRVTAIKIRMVVQSRLRVTSNNAQRILKEHNDILEAVRARDLAGTEQALRRHINNSLTIALGGSVG